MPLERFIPKSPDPNIRNSQDFEVAKFGHLNTIIEYVNTYVVTDSLQLSGIGPLTSTARYITDSLGNASSLAISSGNIGIGTTTPTTKLVVNSTTTALNATFDALSTVTILGSQQAPLRVLRTGGQPNIYIGTSNETPDHSVFLAGIRTGAWYNTASPTYSGQFGAYFINRANQWGTQTSAADLRMAHTFTCNGATTRQALFITPLLAESSTNTDYVAVNNLLVTTAAYFGTQPTARVQIVGDGSTSATTSLLVQNSSGTNLLKVRDDGNVGIGTTTPSYTLQVGSVDDFYVNKLGSGVSVHIGYSIYEYLKGLWLGADHPIYLSGTGASVGVDSIFNSYIYGYQSSTIRTPGADIKVQGYSTPSIIFSTQPTFDGTSNSIVERMRIDNNGNVGIGTTNPFALLTVGGQSSFYSVQSAGVGADFFYSDINPNLTAGANNQIVSLLRLRDRGQANTGGFTGTQRLSLIMENVAGGQFPFQLFSESGALRVGFSSVATPTALVHIQGQGSTSATTSLLVQNSSGSSALTVKDDLSVLISAGGIFGFGDTTNYAKKSGAIDGVEIAGYGGVGLGAFGGINTFVVHSGSASLGATTANASAIFDITSTTKGFLPPRMTTTQRTGIVLPAAGLIVYDTDTNKSYTYDGTAWQAHW